MTGRRDGYLEVCQAGREAIDRVLQAAGDDPPELPLPDDGVLRRSDLRVFLALLRDVVLFSRLSDELARQQIARRAGVSERTVTASMGRLEAAGVIVYERSRTRGRPSVVRFPRPVGANTPLTPTDRDRASTVLPSSPRWGERSGEHSGADSGEHSAPGPEELPEKTENAPACDDCEDGWLCTDDDCRNVTPCPRCQGAA